jgi:hypothetical protein
MAENETHSRRPVSPGEIGPKLPPVEGRLDGHDPPFGIAQHAVDVRDMRYRSLRKALFVVGGTKGSLFQKEQLPHW